MATTEQMIQECVGKPCIICKKRCDGRYWSYCSAECVRADGKCPSCFNGPVVSYGKRYPCACSFDNSNWCFI